MSTGEGPGHSKPEKWVEIGRLGRAHGLKGEIYLRSVSDHYQVILAASKVKIITEKSAFVFELQGVRITPAGSLLRLKGVDNREAAAGLTGGIVLLDRTEFPELQDGEFYYSDLEGGIVKDREGRELGRILYFEEYAQDIMFFEWQGHGVVAIPMVEAYVLDLSTDPPVVTIDASNLEDLLQN